MRPYRALIIICCAFALGFPIAVAALDPVPRSEVDFFLIQEMSHDPAQAIKIKYLRHENVGDQHWVVGEFTEPMTFPFRGPPMVRFKAIPTSKEFEVTLPNGKGVKYP